MSNDQMPSGPTISVRGKKNRVKKIKQTLVLTTTGPTGPTQRYESKWSLTTPLTQGRLALFSVVLGVLALIEGYQGFSPIFSSHAATAGRAPNLAHFYAFMGAVIVLVPASLLWRIVRGSLRALGRFSFLPAVVGVNGRLTIVKFSGCCQACGGKLRFYAKPTRWIDHRNANGHTHREVTERRLAAECSRNPNHWYEIDPAETRFEME